MDNFQRKGGWYLKEIIDMCNSSDRDGSKMEVTKVPVYVALKGCEISAQRAFFTLNNE